MFSLGLYYCYYLLNPFTLKSVCLTLSSTLLANYETLIKKGWRHSATKPLSDKATGWEVRRPVI